MEHDSGWKMIHFGDVVVNAADVALQTPNDRCQLSFYCYVFIEL